MEQEKKNDKLLEVRDLKVSFFTPAGEVKAVSKRNFLRCKL